MTSTDFEAVLSARAEVLARRSRKQATEETKRPVSVITVGTESFGIPTEHLVCIIKSPPVASMPNLPRWLRGVSQIRGELVGVVDVAIWFGLRESSRGDYTAVVEARGRKLGLLVDAVGGFRHIGASDIADGFGGVSIDGHPILATTKDVITILDVPKLFENPDMIVSRGSARRAAGAQDGGNAGGPPNSADGQ